MDEKIVKKLESIIEDAGVNIVFGDGERNLDTITKAISKALTEYRENRKRDKASEKPSKPQQDSINATNNLTDAVIDNANSLDSAANATKDLQKATEDLKESFEDTELLSDAQIQRILQAMGEAALDTANAIFEATTTKFDWLDTLEKSGIRIAGGLDATYTKMANSLGITHDDLTKMITTNSQQFSRMNAMGVESMTRLLDASNNLIGKYGYDAETASSIMLHYSESILKNLSEEEIKNRNISSEVDILGKNMKALSIATGKSVEMLLKEQEEKEKNLLMMKISRDPNMRQFVQLAEHMGIGRDEILAAITGIPNEKSSLMNITPGGQALFQMLEKTASGIKMGDITTTEQMISIFSDAQRDPRILADNQAIERMRYNQAGIYTKTEFGSVISQVGKFFETKLNEYTGQQSSEDENALNAMNKARAESNRLFNLHTEKMALSLGNATKAVNIFADAMGAASNVVNGIGGGWYKAGHFIFSFISSLSLGTIAMTYFADKLLLGGKGITGLMATLSKGFHHVVFSMKALGTAFLRVIAPIGAFSLITIFENFLTSKVFGLKPGEKGYLISKTLINAVGGAVVGWFMGGGSLVGALLGAALGGLWGKWENSMDTQSLNNGDSMISELTSYPASEKNYNTSASTTHNTYYEQRQVRDNESVRIQKESLEFQKRTATNTQALPAAHHEQIMSNNGSLNNTYAHA